MFKWVHISDLHFYNEKRDDVKQMKDSLPEEMKKIKDVNALFITGDFRLAKSATPEDVNNVVDYIENLSDALCIEKRQIYCVPGNHDLERDSLRNAVIQSLRDNKSYTPGKGYFEEKILHTLLDGFSFFKNIETRLYEKSILFNNDDIHSMIQTEGCNILLLNTAITAGNDDDRQNLLIGSKYLQKVLDKIDKTKPTIMVGHHGHSFLHREEVRYIQNRLKDFNIAIYLCGHEHKLSDETVWDNVRQYTAGCIWADESESEANAGYYVGTIDEVNNATIEGYSWYPDQNKWWTRPVNCDKVLLLPSTTINITDKDANKTEISHTSKNALEEKLLEVEKKYGSLQRKKYEFILDGHTLLGGRGKDGIKYYWLKDGERVESIAFNTRTCFPHRDSTRRAEDAEISAYTASVSFGCVLAASNQQCRFCETGSRHFQGFLSAEEIALQNIFMASYDADCPSFPEVRTHKREFAFMGQGEPGFSYPAIRQAILLTDRAMSAIDQEVHRYIISTCGISDFIEPLIHDIESGLFKNRVSLHYSLHAIDEERKYLMPIERQFSYTEFIESCKKFYKASSYAFGNVEKIGVGIMMFKDFSPIQRSDEEKIPPITLNKKRLGEILSILDPSVFKIDLCDLNRAPSVTSKNGEFKNEDAQELLEFTLARKFEAKTFSSFGDDKNAGCGMLKSESNDKVNNGSKTIDKFDKALTLLHYAINELKSEGLS